MPGAGHVRGSGAYESDTASSQHGSADSFADEFSDMPSDDGKPEGERERLIWAMERCGWVQAKAARLLKITPRQIGYALHKYGIEVRRF
jgi:Nif-specific regulatory protein